VTVTQPTAASQCSDAAMSDVESAKSYLFKSSVTTTDLSSATTAAGSALSDSPSCPDANFVSALTDLLNEGNRIDTEVLTTSEGLLPLAVDYDASTTLSRVTKPLTRIIDRSANAGTIDPDDPDPTAVQAEISSNTMTVFTGALTKLNTARSAIQSFDGTWAFTYPIDPANPSLGDEVLDEDDLDILTGALNILVGQLYYALAYDLSIPTGYSSSDPCPKYDSNETLLTGYSDLSAPNYCDNADTNSDGILTPTEYLPPSPYGTLKSDGQTSLNNAKSYISTGLSMLSTAVDNIMAETDPTMAGMNMTSELIGDINNYKHYLSELATSFGGTATSITVPATADCWRQDTAYYRSVSQTGGYYYADEVLDPANNADELVGCEAIIISSATQTINVNFGALFTITDARNALPDYVEDISGYYKISSDIQGDTIGGIFPNGLQTSWEDWGSPSLYIELQNVVDSSTGNLITTMPDYTQISLTVGTTQIPASYAYAGEGYNYIDISKYIETVPTASDYMTFNDTFGVEVTLSVPGYQDKTFRIYGDYMYIEGLSLTPSAP